MIRDVTYYSNREHLVKETPCGIRAYKSEPNGLGAPWIVCRGEWGGLMSLQNIPPELPI